MRTKKNQNLPSSFYSINIFTRRKEILLTPFIHFQFKLALLKAGMKHNEMTE